MGRNISRRDLIRVMGASGLAAGVSGLLRPEEAGGQVSARPDAPPGVQVAGGKTTAAGLVDGEVIQPQRKLPILHQADVLVVGGGPAGVVAALAAQRTGAKVTLVERYGHFGGQWTGGLVLILAGMHDKTNKQVIQGIGEEIMRRVAKLDQGA